MNGMTIIKHGDIRECVRFMCDNCGCEWEAKEIETVQAFHMGNGEMMYFMDCPECGKIRVEGERT